MVLMGRASLKDNWEDWRACKTVNLRIVKSHSWGANIDRHNYDFSMIARIYRLTHEFVVVEINRVTVGTENCKNVVGQINTSHKLFTKPLSREVVKTTSWELGLKSIY